MVSKAIVIGAGPDIRENDHLEKLAKSNYDGIILVMDVMLKDCLEKGVTPDKFPKYYVFSIEDMSTLDCYYSHDICKQYAPKIQAILITIADIAEKAIIANGFKFEKLNHEFGERELQNVGACAWYFAIYHLKVDEVCLIGMNMGYPVKAFENFEPEMQSLFLRYGDNPHWNKPFALDPTYQYYSSTFLEYINASPENQVTINCTEAGPIFGGRIKIMKFGDYLES